MDVLIGFQLAPSLGVDTASGLVLPLEAALRLHNQALARIRYKLSAALNQARIPNAIQFSIFDLAQLWFCFGEETQAPVEGEWLDVVYQRFDPSQVSALCQAPSLRVVRIAVVSHDQGWADSAHENMNTAVDSWTWVERELQANHSPITACEVVYTNRQANDAPAYYQEDVGSGNVLVQQWEPGTAIATRLRAKFPGWTMFAKYGRIMTFHSF